MERVSDRPFESSSELRELAMRRDGRHVLMVWYSLWHRQESTGSITQEPNDEDTEDIEGSSSQNLRHALVNG